MPSRVECVTISVGYSDFLEWSIIKNMPFFDDWVVVTTAEDKDTHRVCKKHGIRHVNCPYFVQANTKFNKALGINLGLAHLTCSDWMVHLDADIILPNTFSKFFNTIPLDKQSIYGIDRVDCPNYEEWMAYQAKPEPQFEWQCMIKPPRKWKIGARIAHFDYGSYVPIGFFQAWNRESGITRYPTIQDSSAEHTDVLHSLQWPREKRHLVPEIFAIHLESEQAPMGANWSGRKTKPFGPAVSPTVQAGMAMPTARMAMPKQPAPPHHPSSHPSPPVHIVHPPPHKHPVPPPQPPRCKHCHDPHCHGDCCDPHYHGHEHHYGHKHPHGPHGHERS